MATEPFAPCVTPVIVNVLPSAAVSLARTLIAFAPLSSATVAVSSTASGGLFGLTTGVTVGSPGAAVSGSSVRTAPKLLPETVPWLETCVVLVGDIGLLIVTWKVMVTLSPAGIVPMLRLTLPAMLGLTSIGLTLGAWLIVA